MTCWTTMLPVARKVSGEKTAEKGLIAASAAIRKHLQPMDERGFGICTEAICGLDYIREKHFGRMGR